MLMIIYIFIFYLCVFAVLFHLIIFPLMILILGRLFNSPTKSQGIVNSERTPMVSILVTCFNEGETIKKKAENLLKLNYPKDKLQIIFASDGPKENPEKWLSPFLKEKKLRLIHYPVNRGKIAVINDTIPYCTGEIVVFTDVDAMLHKESVKKFLPIFQDSGIGGGCGLHRIQTPENLNISENLGQKTFWHFDTVIKQAESRIGSISSCYGTIYAIRRILFTPIPDSVTDDAFQAMGIIRKKRRFVFVPDSLAFIAPPSKNAYHELKRRRRIVLRSLRGLWVSKELFNPIQFGFYSFSLFTFKVLRRLTPFFMIIAILSNIMLFFYHPVWMFIFSIQSFFYTIALAGWLNSKKRLLRFSPIERITSVTFYYCLGNAGTLLGCLDFLKGKKVDRW